jgi:hypothetical protein
MKMLTPLILALMLMISGCCISQRVDYAEIPSWIYKIPVSEKNYYVVGAAGRGLNMQETLQKARENAYYNISNALSFQIFSQSTEAQQNDLNHVKEIQKTCSKAFIKKAQQVDLWIDQNGITGQYQVFVLMEIPKSTFKNEK